METLHINLEQKEEVNLTSSSGILYDEALKITNRTILPYSSLKTHSISSDLRYLEHRISLFRHSLVKMLDGAGGELDGPPPIRRASTVDVNAGDNRHSPSPSPPHPHTHSHLPPHTHAQSRSRLTRRASLDDLEQESCQLTPRIEGRIVILTDEV